MTYIRKRIGDCTVDELIAYCKAHCCSHVQCKYLHKGYCDVFEGAGSPPYNGADLTIEVPLKSKAVHTKRPKKMLRPLTQNGLAVPFDDAFETILICAHRYAVGRRTYMPRLVMDYTRPMLPYLTDRFLSVFLDDIRLQKNWGLGDDCDVQDWTRFEAEVKAEQERRKHDGR